jgi:hypothetical protein
LLTRCSTPSVERTATHFVCDRLLCHRGSRSLAYSAKSHSRGGIAHACCRCSECRSSTPSTSHTTECGSVRRPRDHQLREASHKDSFDTRPDPPSAPSLPNHDRRRCGQQPCSKTAAERQCRQ